MWPYLDINVMSSDAAMAASTLLAIVFFAYLVEWTSIVRTFPDTKAARRVKFGLYGMLMFVTGSFVLSQLPLLGAMNQGGLEGGYTDDVWLSTGLQFVILMAGMLQGAFVKRS